MLVAGADLATCNKYGATTLFWAAEAGHAEVVQQLLAAGADQAACDNDGATALFWAAREGHAEVVQQLLAAGADLAACNNVWCHGAILGGLGRAC